MRCSSSSRACTALLLLRRPGVWRQLQRLPHRPLLQLSRRRRHGRRLAAALTRRARRHSALRMWRPVRLRWRSSCRSFAEVSCRSCGTRWRRPRRALIATGSSSMPCSNASPSKTAKLRWNSQRCSASWRRCSAQQHRRRAGALTACWGCRLSLARMTARMSQRKRRMAQRTRVGVRLGVRSSLKAGELQRPRQVTPHQSNQMPGCLKRPLHSASASASWKDVVAHCRKSWTQGRSSSSQHHLGMGP
mmetsp:Transcript_57271/g.178000  ORF Transcript_57271/g.178000 Transcript_57271/m.178000 type:complete len:247 (+) Transcript_57271:1026-1766(+)